MSCGNERLIVIPMVGCEGKSIPQNYTGVTHAELENRCMDRSMIPVKYAFRKDGFNKIQEPTKPKKKGRKWAKKV